MYRKVLIPMDRSEESERVFGSIKAELSPDAEVIFLHVIPPMRTRLVDEDPRLGDTFEQLDRYDGFDYLRGLVDRLGDELPWWRCDVAMAESIPDCIVEFADLEDVDLVAMCTHRMSCERLVTSAVAKRLLRGTSARLWVFEPRELRPSGALLN